MKKTSVEGIGAGDMSVGAAVEVGIRANKSWDDATAEMLLTCCIRDGLNRTR